MRYIVVGAGAAGCLVSARLAEESRNDVLLIEAGLDRRPDNRPIELTSRDFTRVLSLSEAFDPRARAQRHSGGPMAPYARGWGVGGSAALNGMVCVPGLAADYDRWASELGCDGWAWSDIGPWFDIMRSELMLANSREFTPVDEALWLAADYVGIPTRIDTYGPDEGVGYAYLSASDRARRSTAEALLDIARASERLTVLSSARVLRVILSSSAAVGVELDNGQEIYGDHVVLCAGAFETPALLLRSGLTHQGIGMNLRDHPSARLNFRLRVDLPPRKPGLPCINVVARGSSSVGVGDVQLLPMFGALEAGLTSGAILTAVMSVDSVGRVLLDPTHPRESPRVEMNMLESARDRVALRDAVDFAVRVLDSEPFANIILAADEGSLKTPPLHSMSEVPDRWPTARLGDYYHACGTCRMGSESNPDAVVDSRGAVLGVSGLHVMDASVFPDIPSANTYWPTVVLAERLTANLMERTMADVPAWSRPRR